MAALLSEHFFSFGLVHGDEARCPAIGKTLPVQLIKDARQGRGRKTENGQRAQMRVTDHRLQPASEGLIGEHGVEEDRQLRRHNRMALDRDGRVEIGQRLIVS